MPVDAFSKGNTAGRINLVDMVTSKVNPRVLLAAASPNCRQDTWKEINRLPTKRMSITAGPQEVDQKS